MTREASPGRGLAALFAFALVGLLAIPLVALATSVGPRSLAAGFTHPLFGPAAWLSLRTSALAMFLTVLGGLPLAYWLARSDAKLRPWVGALVALPIVVPPSVLGVALLRAFGRQGWLGSAGGGSLAFGESAVVLAQLIVAAPFFVHAAANAFRDLDPQLVAVARTLGATRAGAMRRVVLPAARPGLLAALGLAWARALGEFGATLLFAGSLPGRTQTLPLAIFHALESDVTLAVTLSVLLLGLGALLFAALRLAGGRARRAS